MEQKFALSCAEEITTLKNQVLLKRQRGPTNDTNDPTKRKPRSESSADDLPLPGEINADDIIPRTAAVIFLRQSFSNETKEYVELFFGKDKQKQKEILKAILTD